jgi:RHS repeat-associated protein
MLQAHTNKGGNILVLTEAKAPKNGYVYVYLSNESLTPVYFDNLKVKHERGQIVAEDHYYAYGLKIAAISSKALSSSLNPSIAKYGYQGSYAEEVTEFELNYNEFALRTYDPQIGRWTTPDPYNEFASPYVGMGADPANLTDPTGGMSAGGAGLVSMLGGAILGAGVDAMTGGDGRGMIYGAAIGLGMGIGFNVSINFMGQALQGLGVAAQAVGAAVGSTPPPVVNSTQTSTPDSDGSGTGQLSGRGGPNAEGCCPGAAEVLQKADQLATQVGPYGKAVVVVGAVVAGAVAAYEVAASVASFIDKSTGTAVEVSPTTSGFSVGNQWTMGTTSYGTSYTVKTTEKTKIEQPPAAQAQPIKADQVQPKQDGYKKGGGKNGKHKNKKAKDSAKQKYEEWKKKFDELDKKTNKTKADKEATDKARTQMNHWKKKADETGENHSQKPKK